MSNKEIKAMLKENRIFMWEVAKRLGVYETSFCKWFRDELSAERQQMVISAVEEIKLERLKEQK